MAEYHYVRRSAASTGAVNVAIAVDLPIDSTASTPITSPGGVIKQIAFSHCLPAAVVATSGVVWSIRIAGAAVVNGPQDIDVGSIHEGASDTAVYLIPPGQNRIDVNIPLKVNLPVTVQAFMNGLDTGTQMVQVELVIEA
jgi:hypothetical protein